MRKITPRELVIGDVVLVEAKVMRRNLSMRRTPISAKWQAWRVEFALHSISKLVPRITMRSKPPPDNQFPLSM